MNPEDDWSRTPLGIPEPPVLDTPYMPQQIPMSVAIDVDDVRMLARAERARVRYVGRVFPFSAADLDAVNAAYRIAVCMRR